MKEHFKSNVEHLLKAIATLKQQGLIGVRLVCTFMQHRVQLALMPHQNPFYKYSDVNDPDRHSSEPLTLTEIEA